MSSFVRSAYPAGVPCWVEVETPDTDAAAAFYGGLFGWEIEERPVGRDRRSLVGRLDGCDVAGISSIGPDATDMLAPAVWTTSIAVVDAHETVRAVRDAGGAVLDGPRALAGAGHTATCADPAGAVVKVWQAIGRAGAQLVNAPGSWNWSDLFTSDPDGARAFYGTVFGWVAQPVDFGIEQATMWRVPGYSYFLAAGDPDRRRRHADAGAPAGFADAVGWMHTSTSGVQERGGDDAAAWQVTFAVADTDDVVERAATLGAKVIVPPYDVDKARVAVLMDPDGAAFTVSRYDC